MLSRDRVSHINERRQKYEIKKAMSSWRDVCKEEIWRLPEIPKTSKNLPEFHKQELATLAIHLNALSKTSS